MQLRGYEVYLRYQAGNVLLYLPEFYSPGDLSNQVYLEELLARMDLLASFIEQRDALKKQMAFSHQYMAAKGACLGNLQQEQLQ
ncbi:hypothetical protein [Shouchella patagoniensis]|uniref:hypothetical protein n=1 Tax=Shouchella patagoniensis TaxID=228576 RepID=UPI000995C55F|nr:hypothetical protein [Shouchella patagoniensis]